MQIKKRMIARDVAGETILVPVGTSVQDVSGLFMLSPTGAFIWNILPDCETSEEIAEKLLEEYEVDRATAQADAEKFLRLLKEHDII